MEKTEKKTPSDSITLTIEKNDYTIKFPNTGKFIDIEKEKIRMAGGYQNQLMETNNGFHARMLIDTIATFSVLIPDFTKALNKDSIFDTDMLFSKKLVKVYTKDFMPWYNQWVEILQDIDND